MIMTPKCPECGQLPDLILADGHQCFCETPDCLVITWDSHLTAAENRAATSLVEWEDGADDGQ